MQKLSELKTSLSSEKQKPKNERNNDLIRILQEKINDQKSLLRKEFKNRQKEKHKARVELQLSLYKKKNDQYGKIRAEKKQQQLEHERLQREKLQPKKSKK